MRLPIGVTADDTPRTAFNLGGLVNALRFHFELAYVLLTCPANRSASSGHWTAVTESFRLMRRLATRLDVDDPQRLLDAIQAAETQLAGLNRSEPYFIEEALAAQQAFVEDGYRFPVSRYLRPLLERDVLPICERLRAGLRSVLPVQDRPSFDLGYLFDQGLRRPDATEFVRLETGRPRIPADDEQFDSAAADSKPLEKPSPALPLALFFLFYLYLLVPLVPK